MAATVFCVDMLRVAARRDLFALRTAFNGIGLPAESVGESMPRRRCFSCWRSHRSELAGGSALRSRSLTPVRQYAHNPNCKYPAEGGRCCGGNQEESDDPSSPCWRCGRNARKRYFCECGVVQPPVTRRSLFEVMGVKETFDVDINELTEKYRGLQRILHPDKYSQKSETEQEFSEQHSTLVNRAYKTLKRPLARGLYLLQLTEEKLEQQMQITGADFLNEILETNEEILDARSADEISTIGARNQAKIDSLVLSISEAFKNNDLKKAKDLLLRLKYYSNIADKIKDTLQKYAE